MRKTVLALALLVLGSNLGADVLGKATDLAVASAVSRTSAVADQIVTTTIATLKDAKTFVMAQAPQVIKEFLVWRMTQCAFWFGLGLFLVGLVMLGSWRLRASDPKGPAPRFVSGMLRWFVAPFLFIIFCAPNIYEMLYIYLAPRVYLIENVVHLVKFGQLVQ